MASFLRFRSLHKMFFKVGLPMMKYVLLALIVSASPAFGLVYSWTDSRGVAHYTNKEYEIPARYRAKARALYPEPADTAQQPQAGQAGQAQQARPEAAPAPPQAQPEEPQRPAPIRRRHHRGAGSGG